MDSLTTASRVIFGIAIILLIMHLGATCDNTLHNLGAGFKYDEEHRSIHYWEYGKQDTIKRDIPPTITKYKELNGVIYVQQKPKFPPDVMYPDYTYTQSEDSTYYWIIIKSKRAVIGPLTKEEFDNNPYSASF